MQLLGDVSPLFFLAEDDPSGVGLHQVVAAGLGGDVFEDHLHVAVGGRRAHQRRRRSIEHPLAGDVEGDRRHAVVGSGRIHVAFPGVAGTRIVRNQMGQHQGRRVGADHVHEATGPPAIGAPAVSRVRIPCP